ncbi:MAG: acyl-CoA dehydrogenase family protein [Bacteroidia bacterium]
MKTVSPKQVTYPAHKNRVLKENFKTSANFYHSDKIFRNYLRHNISKEGLSYMHDKLEMQGKESAGRMNELSLTADKNGPQLIKRNPYGETTGELGFHPSYWELRKIAVQSEMFRVKWDPTLRKKFRGETHSLGFSTGYLFALSESGQYCPHCMTDGGARLVDLYCDEEDKKRILPHVYTTNSSELFTGAMFLTEKTGGSDVGANIVTATHDEGKYYLLNGEKWFCSNAGADFILVLARTDSSVTGTKGLSIFLVDKYLPDGTKNPIEIIRLKDKLGMRSMESAECMLTNTRGKLIGNEMGGFKLMIEMINISRLYNSVAALTCARRALIEAYQFLSFRKTFGKDALEHALIRTKLTELGSLHVANFYLVWRAIKALDLADSGNEREKQLFRMIVPMSKKWSAEAGVYITRESMELMGGLGYIEDTVIPKIMRDVMVMPIWEGSGNIIILDMIRAMVKSQGFEVLCEEISSSAGKNKQHGSWIAKELSVMAAFPKKLSTLPQDEMEATAKVFFEKLISLYQISLLVDALNDESSQWLVPAIDYLKSKYEPAVLKEQKPISPDEVRNLIAWEI